MACGPANLDASCLKDVVLENLFVAMAKGGDSKADGRTLSQKSAEAWLTKAQVGMTQGDVASAFQKAGKTAVNYAEFSAILTGLAKSKGADLKAIKDKLVKVPAP